MFNFLSNAQSRLINVPGTLALQHTGVTPRGKDMGHVLDSLSGMFTWSPHKIHKIHKIRKRVLS